jgi:hypothetical protein
VSDDGEERGRRLNDEFMVAVRDFVQKNGVTPIELVGLCEGAKQVAWWATLGIPVEEALGKSVAALRTKEKGLFARALEKIGGDGNGV